MTAQYTQPSAGTRVNTPDVYYDADATTIVSPKDRVRWASVIAGLFTTMAALIFFTVLGVAIGAAAWDPNQPNNFGLGTGIYSIVTSLIAFFLGGFVAARTAAVTGRDNGLLNGAMVWVTTIVLVINFLGAGLGMLLGTAADAAATVAGETAGNLAANVLESGDVNALLPDATGEAGVNALTNADQGANVQAQPQIQVSPQDAEDAANAVSQAAWLALLAMVVTAAAALAGGIAGARPYPTRRTDIA